MLSGFKLYIFKFMLEKFMKNHVVRVPITFLNFLN